MALTFPLTAAQFITTIAVEKITWHLTQNVEQNTTGSGEILRVGRGTRAWYGTVYCDADEWADYEATMALVREMEDGGGSFLMTPLHMQKTGFPNGVVNTISGRQVRISGIGAARAVPRGTFFSFTYGSPLRYSLHQFSEAVTADAAGLTPLAQIVPPIPAGVATGSAAIFAQPLVKAHIVPGSVREPDIRKVLAEPFSFDWRQTKL